MTEKTLTLNDFNNVKPQVEPNSQLDHWLRLSEELGELALAALSASQAIAKAVRFGPDCASPLYEGGISNQQRVESEVGDVLARLERAYKKGIISEVRVWEAKVGALKKMEQWTSPHQP